MDETIHLRWHRVLGLDELAEGQVCTVFAGARSLCMTHHQGRYAALENVCPHAGAPLGEGSIEGDLLRCPWHGWHFDPCSGLAFGGDGEGVAAYPVDVREDGIYVGL